MIVLAGRTLACPFPQDSLPVHYLLMDSIGINFNLERNLFLLTQSELRDTTLPWWDRSVLYRNLYASAVNLFLPISEIKRIWSQEYQNDPYSACERVEQEYARMKSIQYNKNIPWIGHCILMRERDFFQSRCQTVFAQYDSLLMKELRGLRDVKQYSREVQDRLESILSTQGRYPGRSLVGGDLELVIWSILQKADSTILEKYLPMLKEAVKTKDLHPQFLAASIDKLQVLKGLPQVYGTQYRIVDDKEQVYPIRDMKGLDELRGGMGLGKFGSSNSSLGNYMENGKRDD